MTSTKVAISSVTLDPPFTKHPTRQRYRVTLECGCYWWEDHAETEQRPIVGQMVNCYAPHSARAQALPEGLHAGGSDTTARLEFNAPVV